jgi:Skp family chaperone for outer membrane proteins
MVKTTTNLLLFSLLQASVLVNAESKPTAIVTVSGQEVMMNSDTGKAVQDRLKDAQTKLAAPLQKEGQAIQAKEQKLIDKDKDPKSDKSALEFEKRELGLQIQKLQAKGQEIETKLSEMYQKEMGKFEALVKETIKELAQKHAWDIVLMEEQAVYVNKKAVSKTTEVIAELDKRAKAANLAKKQALENDMKKDTAPAKKSESEDSSGHNSY